MPAETSDIAEPLDTQQQVTAILAQIADADKSEGRLTCYFALRASCDKEVWREVIGMLAQGCGNRDL